MAIAGDMLENPKSGQCIIFRKTASDTGGELLEVESVYAKPTPSRPPAGCSVTGPATLSKAGEYSLLNRVR